MANSGNPTLRESIAGKILSEILTGRLCPGDSLPSEREIAGKYGVSRSIVHLALEQLAQAGFIEVRPRSGTYVADFVNQGNFSTLAMLSQVDAGMYQQSYREAMVEIRNVLEGLAMRTIAANKRAEDFAALEERMETLRKTAAETKEIPAIAEELKKVHMEILRRGGNFISTMVMNSFYDNASRLWENCVTFWGIETTLRETEKILGLLREGRGEECSGIINEMFRKYKEAKAV